jgi:hypothetical protein
MTLTDGSSEVMEPVPLPERLSPVHLPRMMHCIPFYSDSVFGVPLLCMHMLLSQAFFSSRCDGRMRHITCCRTYVHSCTRGICPTGHSCVRMHDHVWTMAFHALGVSVSLCSRSQARARSMHIHSHASFRPRACRQHSNYFG